jgi:predicted nucleic acid-binding protein
MLALDTSLLAFAINRYAPEHARAARVVERLAEGERPWGLPSSVVYEFLGIVTHPHSVARALSPLDALGFLDELLATPGARLLAPGPRHAAVLRETLELTGTTPGLPPGLETAALLREHGVRELLSADRGMRRFPFLDVRDPLRGAEWTPDEPPARRYRVLGVRRGPRPGSLPASTRERSRS